MELRGSERGGGGPDKTILLSALKHQKSKFFILVTYLRNPRDENFQIGFKAKELGITNFIEVIDESILDFKCLFKLNHLIKEYKIQIIHVHDLKTTLLGVLLKLLNHRVKIMHTAHGWIINSKSTRVKQKIQFFLLKFYPFHIAVSKATKSILVENGISTHKIHTLYNAIDTEYWNRNDIKSTIREEFNINCESPIIGTIGRISKEKDLNSFLQIAKNILAVIPESRFLIVGEGLENEIMSLKNKVTELGLNDSMIFTGHRTDLRNIYSGLDIFVMTSLTEGLPNTVLEAMAMQVPVVATKVGGVPELIKNGRSGILHKPRDVTNITKSVVKLLKDKEIEKKLSISARKRIEKRFSFNFRLKMIEEYYLRLNKNNF